LDVLDNEVAELVACHVDGADFVRLADFPIGS